MRAITCCILVSAVLRAAFVQDAERPAIEPIPLGEPVPIVIPEPDMAQANLPLTEGLTGLRLKAALEDALRAAMSQNEGEDFPSTPFEGQVVRVTNPAGASPGTYRRNDLGEWEPMWREVPYAVVPVQVIDKNLIIWNSAEPTSPGDDIYNIREASYFELLLNSSKTVTLPDGGNSSATKPLIFHNKSVGAGIVATFQRQQFPVGNDDKMSPYNADIDIELHPGELLVLASDLGVNGRWVILHERRNPVIAIDHTDSPFTMKWWHRRVMSDASGGAVTINLPDAESAAQHPGSIYDYTVINTGASGSTTVQPQSGNLNGGASDVLSSQWQGGSYFSDETDYFKKP